MRQQQTFLQICLHSIQTKDHIKLGSFGYYNYKCINNDDPCDVVNGVGNVSSSYITFSNQDLCPNCKWDWQHAAAFLVIFSGHPISRLYIWQYTPGPQALEGNYSGALSLYKKVLTINP